MKEEPMPTGDRGVDIYHMIRSAERWRGFILEVPSQDTRDLLQKSLNEILAQNKYPMLKTDGGRLYFKGNYGDDTITQLKKVIGSHMGEYSQKPMDITGSYFNFLQDYWVEEAIEKFRIKKEDISSRNP